MRRLLLVLALVPLPAAAEIASVEDCAVAADPDAAREEAAVWARSGGGVAARLCEADALAALGAHATAAALLTRLAENPNRAIEPGLRAVILGDSAGQWLDAGRRDLAVAALDQADRVADPDPDRLVLRARAAAADADWPAARTSLDRAIAADPRDALAHALLAAALRNLGDPEAALAESEGALRLDPQMPEALFEAAAARAETGDFAAANRLWQRLLALHPQSALASPARANLQRLN